MRTGNKMFTNLGGEETESLLTIFLLLTPASLYIMGLMKGKAGYRLFLAGILFHVAGIIQRGMIIGGIPLSEKHDNISFMALCLASVYVYSFRTKPVTDTGLAALPLISLSALLPLMFEPVNTLSPFLRSPWFYLHIFLYFISYGFFGIASCFGLFYLVTGNSEYELDQYRTSVTGWIIFSIALVMGSIWFFVAYGSYWIWTSRELWVTLTWFYYGLYLHARLMKGFRGKPAAAAGLLGFAVALFTYFGLGTVIPSPPTQF